jgi:hypothetical protein
MAASLARTAAEAGTSFSFFLELLGVIPLTAGGFGSTDFSAGFEPDGFKRAWATGLRLSSREVRLRVADCNAGFLILSRGAMGEEERGTAELRLFKPTGVTLRLERFEEGRAVIGKRLEIAAPWY